MKRLLMIALCIAVVAAFASPVIAKRKGPDHIRFDMAQKSAVDFNHGMHEAQISDCKTCHHMGVGSGTCRDCHGVHPAAPSMKRAMHKSCKTCHAKMKIAKKKDCAFCHK